MDAAGLAEKSSDGSVNFILHQNWTFDMIVR